MASTAAKKYMTDENGDQFYPIGHVGAIYDDNGNTLSALMDDGWGAKWYSGTAMSGTSTSANNYSYSACPQVKVGDYYLNSSYGYVYRCTTAGSGTAAKWTYQGSIRGASGSNATVTVDTAMSNTSTNPVQNKVVKSAIDGKANSSHTHTTSDITDMTDYLTYVPSSGGTSGQYLVARGDNNTPVWAGPFYGTCSTASNVADKVTDSGAFTNITLYPGTRIFVKFTNASYYGGSSVAIRLNVGGTGLQPVYYGNTAQLNANDANTGWISGDVVELVWSGTYWLIISSSYSSYVSYMYDAVYANMWDSLNLEGWLVSSDTLYSLNGSVKTQATYGSFYAPTTGKNGSYGGGVLYSNSSGAPSWTSYGTSGYFLKANGTNSAPTWTNTLPATTYINTTSYRVVGTTTGYNTKIHVASSQPSSMSVGDIWIKIPA